MTNYDSLLWLKDLKVMNSPMPKQLPRVTASVPTRSRLPRHSASADLTIFGFTEKRLREKGVVLFQRHAGLGDVLFVAAEQRILIE